MIKERYGRICMAQEYPLKIQDRLKKKALSIFRYLVESTQQKWLICMQATHAILCTNVSGRLPAFYSSFHNFCHCNKLHEFHEPCHSVTFIVLVHSHQRWKQTLNRSLLSSLMWIDSGIVVSQHRLESFFHEIKCNGMTIFMEFMMRPNVTSQFLICPPEVAFDRDQNQKCQILFWATFFIGSIKMAITVLIYR